MSESAARGPSADLLHMLEDLPELQDEDGSRLSVM